MSLPYAFVEILHRTRQMGAGRVYELMVGVVIVPKDDAVNFIAHVQVPSILDRTYHTLQKGSNIVPDCQQYSG
ncbi:MAG: hypothetical protein JWN64_276 [Parcubacteria group bacterium]|nr:hypothetical protein [Parcubacteria group bacterium]